jgi:2-polyprenyl-3-methyl-5-hydroxy-6-metoxy-1,4-benzoquinol methylase
MPDPRSLLAIPRAYTLFQNAVGADRSRRRYVAEHVRPRPGDAILDVGCGPADILGHLPGVRYHGLDLSESYVTAARQRYGNRGTFECRAVADLAADRPGGFDVVMANGVLHHLPDEDVRHLFRVAARLLKPGGRWVSFDG